MTVSLKIIAGIIGIAVVSTASYFGIKEITKEDLTPHLVKTKLEKGALDVNGDSNLWTERDFELSSYADPRDEQLKAIKNSPVSERKNNLIKWCEQKYKEDSRKLGDFILEEIKKFCTKKISEQITNKKAIANDENIETNCGNSWTKLKGDTIQEDTLSDAFKRVRSDHKSKSSGTDGQDALRSTCDEYKQSPYLNEKELLFKNIIEYYYVNS